MEVVAPNLLLLHQYTHINKNAFGIANNSPLRFWAFTNFLEESRSQCQKLEQGRAANFVFITILSMTCPFHRSQSQWGFYRSFTIEHEEGNFVTASSQRMWTKQWAEDALLLLHTLLPGRRSCGRGLRRLSGDLTMAFTEPCGVWKGDFYLQNSKFLLVISNFPLREVRVLLLGISLQLPTMRPHAALDENWKILINTKCRRWHCPRRRIETGGNVVSFDFWGQHSPWHKLN